MTGRIVDRAALTLFGTAALYLYFLNAGLSIPLSGLAAFLCACAARWLIRHRPRRYRCDAGQARAALLAIVQREDAEDALRALVAALRPDDPRPVVPLVRHPEGTLSAADVLTLWRAHRGGPDFTLAVSCAVDPRARSFAEGLVGPSLQIADARQLAGVIRRTGMYLPEHRPPASVLSRVRGIFSALTRRPPGPRVPLFGLSLMAGYLATGKVSYLAAGLCLLGLSGVKWIAART